MGDKKSTSGTLAPMTYVFIPAGKKPETCFKTVLSASHQANLFAVANGRLDAATNNSTALALNNARGEGQAARIRVIWQSDPCRKTRSSGARTSIRRSRRSCASSS
jgi:phosphonate transport system substrate-binding protein